MTDHKSRHQSRHQSNFDTRRLDGKFCTSECVACDAEREVAFECIERWGSSGMTLNRLVQVTGRHYTRALRTQQPR